MKGFDHDSPRLDTFGLDHGHRGITEFRVIDDINGFPHERMFPCQEMKIVSGKGCVALEGAGNPAVIEERQFPCDKIL